MTFSVKELRPEHVRAVVDAAWQRGKDEAEVYGVSEAQKMTELLWQQANEYGYALFHDDVLIAVFGAAFSSADNAYATWFLATDDLLKVGRHATYWLRGFVKERTHERPDAKLKIMTAANHPEADRWFRALGFSLMEDDGRFKHYLYTRG